jgi:hypothetical protein
VPPIELASPKLLRSQSEVKEALSILVQCANIVALEDGLRRQRIAT